MSIRIMFDGTGVDCDDRDEGRVHSVMNYGSDHALCGLTMDHDPETMGEFVSTKRKINCPDCVAIISHGKSIKSHEWLKEQK